MNWTEKQLEAIETNNKNILVAAAAGSGKTAVLVERIIQKILKQNVDIDKLLVVTFTNAAASEIRQRVLEAIYKKLEDEPDNENLQKQIVLLNKSNISTIHSFCLNVIKNNFFEIGISPDFRIGDNSELELLKLEALDEVFEELYEENNQQFIKLTEIYTGYRGDERLKEIVLKIYNFIQSSPFPEEWLIENINKFNLSESLDGDFKDTEWGKIILEEIKENIDRNIVELKAVLADLQKDEELKKYYDVILLDIEVYEKALQSLTSWDLAYNNLTLPDFKRWPTDKKIESELKENAKVIRTNINTGYKDLIKKLVVTDSENANKDIFEMHHILVYLQETVLRFMQKFKSKKQSKNVIDFNDIEHYALQILVKKDMETGIYVPTEIAKSYRDKFQEIAIDEYQDSNSVQECILSAISNGHNMFMVGDVKQSIYRFRQARPELFLDKYNRFKLKEEFDDINRKIQLFNNFRSRELVLKFANLVFTNIMNKKVGNIDYTREEYLNFTAKFEEPQNIDNSSFAGKMSFEIIDTKDIISDIDEGTDEDYEDYEDDEDNDYDIEAKSRLIEDIQENLEKIELEARYVAFRIKEIIDSKYNVYDKELKAYRPATYRDFVILLRSTSTTAAIFEKEIFKLGMPAFSDGSQKYLESIEIETILNLLKVIDNPMQDIALVSVLRSYIGDFNDNELLEIRLNNIKSTFYESMITYKNNSILKDKIETFLNKLKNWQDIVKYMPLDEFIWKLYIDTGYYNYVSMMNDGTLKVANLKMLFERAKQYESASFKGLYNFIRFMDKLKKNEGELENAKLIGENDNVIRIMSIHKSKGLEFPIVFLSTTGKKFNLRDLNDNLLLHQDLGIGPKYVNYERKIEYNTLAREALKIKLKNDSLSEEMRVLYVALTRPKEKLIITGAIKDAEKKLEEKRVLLDATKSGNNIEGKLTATQSGNDIEENFVAQLEGNLEEQLKESSRNVNISLLKKYTSYLDWLELAYLNDKEKMDETIDFNILNIENIVDKYSAFNKEVQDNSNNIKVFLKNYKFDKDDYNKIEDLLSFKYKNQELTVIQSKMSVTALKELIEQSVEDERIEIRKENEEVNTEIKTENEKLNKVQEQKEVGKKEEQKAKIKKVEEQFERAFVLDKPKFMKDDVSKLTSAEIGTITHLVFQKIDFNKEYSLESLEKEIDKYVEKDIITKEQKEVINIEKIYKFVKSDFAERIRKAKSVQTEAPFYMNIDVADISKIAKEQELKEKILVQGIIDLYFEEDDGKLVLLDYKTDYIEPEQEQLLVDRHKKQLLMYKKALEDATGKVVKEIYIYSTCLDKEINLYSE